MLQSLPTPSTIKLLTVIPRQVLDISDVDVPWNPRMELSTKMLDRMKNKYLSLVLCAAAIVSAFATTGCQVSVAGQTLPSPYYIKDDIQYFPKGAEFKLSREAAALKESRSEMMGDR